MTKTYLFYDLETSGLSKSFDQILQFAAIRTDLRFNEIEREQFYVRLSPDTIPSPMATITHQISIKDCAAGIPENEAVKKIHAMVNQPGTISLGYNTLQFDDEFLRFSFYRHLLPPYTHQYANGCSRMDLYPITAMFSLFKEDALNWKNIEGKRSLKLESLNQENDLAVGEAHDAMVDVEATLALAKRLAAHKDMWNYLLPYFDKQSDQERMMKLPLFHSSTCGLHYEALIADTKVGSRSNYLAPVICLGTHRHYKNQTLWLRLDLPELQSVSQKAVNESTWVIHKRLAEPGFLLPPLERYYNRIDAERQALVNSNKEWLLAHPEVFAMICEYHQEFKYPNYPSTDPAALLYSNPFPSSAEQGLYAQFLKATPIVQVPMLDRFVQKPLRELALRLVGRYHVDTLPEALRAEYDDYLKSVFTNELESSVTDFKGVPRITKSQVLAEIKRIRAEKVLDEKRLFLLGELEGHLIGGMY